MGIIGIMGMGITGMRRMGRIGVIGMGIMGLEWEFPELQGWLQTSEVSGINSDTAGILGNVGMGVGSSLKPLPPQHPGIPDPSTPISRDWLQFPAIPNSQFPLFPQDGNDSDDFM